MHNPSHNPIQSRVNFKLSCFVFSSLSGHAPSYLSDDIHLVSEGPRRHLRSSTDKSCVVPRTYNTFGDRSFAVVAGPRVWNSLPGHLRDEDITYSSFRRELKTYWFSSVTSEHIRLFYFLVFFLFLHFFSCRFRAVD